MSRVESKEVEKINNSRGDFKTETFPAIVTHHLKLRLNASYFMNDLFHAF